jgi:hypothetical protein
MVNYPAPEQALWDALMARPTITIPISATAADGSLVTRPCILVGWSLRDSTTFSGWGVEFLDGPADNGQIVGEANAPPQQVSAGVNNDVDVDASSAAAAAANNVILPAAVGATTFITGFEITGTGATGTSTVTITVTGILGGTKTYFMVIPAGAALADTSLIIEYARPIPASALNTAITVNVPSFGAGNLNAAVTAHGFQRTVTGSANVGNNSTTSGPSANPVLCRSGLFLEVLAGTVAGCVWVKV